MGLSRGLVTGVCSSLLLLGVAVAPRSGEAAYAVVDLGTLGGPTSEASAINDAGLIVGWSSTETGQTHGFLYRDGDMTDLGTLPGGSESRATGVDDLGRVVGFGGINAFGPQFQEITQGFVWQNGLLQPLGALFCPCSFNRRYGTSAAYGIADGRVVGASETVRGSAVLHAFAWDAGAFEDIGGGAGNWSVSRAFAVNRAGQIVGDFAENAGMATPPFDRRATLWTAATRQDLGALTGHTSSQALGLNAAGVAVGWSGTIEGQTSRAVMWERGVIRDLGALPGDQAALARGINAGGQVVGQSGTPGGGPSRAFLWQDGIMRDLNTLIPDGSGWTLTSAAAINGSGQIVGVGFRNGRSRAVLLVEQAAGSLPVAAAVLPSSRSVAVNATATAFATIINPGAVTATGCAIAPEAAIQGTFAFQTTDPATNRISGAAGAPANIPAGGRQTFVFAITPVAAEGPEEISLNFQCDNMAPARVLVGVNTLLLVASATPAPDIVSLAATLSNDGIVEMAGVGATGVFAVAMANVGTSGIITVSADAGDTSLPLRIAICETEPATGLCLGPLAPSATRAIGAGETPTFGVFVTASDVVPFAPDRNRIFVRARDEGNVIRGSTSVAIRTR